MILMNSTIENRSAVCRGGRRAQAATLAGVAAVLVPAGVGFAAATPTDAAGGVVTDLGGDGASFVTTYGLPALGVALGVALLWAMTRKVGKRVIGSF